MAVTAPRTAPRTQSSSPGQVQRWDPFREVEQLQEETGRLLGSVWPRGVGDGGAWTPFADVEG